MEKKQLPAATTAASAPQGVCERLFNAFNLHSTFPTVRRLTFRQQEAAAPPNPSSPEKKHPIPTPVKPEPAAHVPPEKEAHEKKKQAHEEAKPKEKEKDKDKKEEKGTTAVVQPAPVSQQKGSPAPKAAAEAAAVPRTITLAQNKGAAAEGRKAGEKPPADNHQEIPDQHHAKHRKGINDKVDDYINRAKTKMRSSTMTRTPTSKPN